ncbi:DUF305 domain-containing protein [Spirillospora albida]|uniref:DUF305 domain-containing protein n=1 Tax=Spirillospora albida TaxID=58123 RepID=UPI0004C1421A|nr:DUF305 domain-containing protein [Spirillospora albida]
MKHVRTLVIVPVLAFALAACGDDDTSMPRGPMQGSGSPSAQTAQHNQQDITFAQMMVPHHRQAIEMARLAESRAASSEVRSLAADIEKAQGPEIEQLSAWLTSWGSPLPSGMHHEGMPGMMGDRQLKDLAAADGKAFDKAFLELMIVHHEGAVEMAETEQAKGAFPAAKAMAGRIASSQTAEIATMRALLKKM